MRHTLKHLTLILFTLSLLLSQACKNSNNTDTNSTVFHNAAVVCAYPDASKVGVDILKKGGNAVDAAVAVAFALEVVYPAAGNIGGGGFMVLRLTNGEINSLDFREKAPATATRDMYLDKDGNVILGSSLNGAKAAGVPGSVDGMYTAHEKYGKLPWKDVIQPAIDLARNGYKLTKREADGLNGSKDEFIKYNSQNNYFINSNPWKEGDVVKQEDLAKTLELIRDKGRDGFYTGINADKIVSTMQAGNGLITLDDLKNYQSIWRKPVTGSYKGYEIITMPPPSSGGIALMQLLKMTEAFPIDKLGFHSADEIHLITEIENRVYADRSKWLGDPDFFHVPMSQLLDSSYLVSRMSSFNKERATPPSEIKPGEFDVTEKNETTHYSIVDQWGNAVAVTTTLNGGYGCKVFVNGAGFVLNDEMDDFSSKPGVPNMFGLIGGEANAIEPGKRMLSSMTPTIVTKDGKLFMVLGSPGGSTIITTVYQNIINVIDFGNTMQQAVDAPRFHSQWLPDEIIYEKNAIDSLTAKKLQSMGHKIEERSVIGCCDAILIKPNKDLEAAADKRGDDTAEGW